MEDAAFKFDAKASGVIAGIGHGTMRDGPGWRTIIYFKGCNFRCRWCSSPDTFSGRPEPLFFPERLKYPARLAGSCPHSAIMITEDGFEIAREKCAVCETFICAELNIDGAVSLSGRTAAVGELLAETLRYARPHEKYGVTLSGGEATMQWGFFIELLKAFKYHGMHTAVETNCSHPNLPDSFKFLDLVICDLKCIESESHEKWTGVKNDIVLRNIAAAAASGSETWVRIPVVAGATDGKNIEESVAFLKQFRTRIKVELLAYHRLGEYKWAACGKEYQMQNSEPPDADEMQRYEKLFEAEGIEIIRT